MRRSTPPQAYRLRRAPGGAFQMLRHAVGAAASALRKPAATVAAAPLSAIFVAPPLMFAAAAAEVPPADAAAPRWRPSLLRSPAGGVAAAAPEHGSELPFPRLYQVRQDDTLWGIAQDAYGDGTRFADILAANPGAMHPWTRDAARCAAARKPPGCNTACKVLALTLFAARPGLAEALGDDGPGLDAGATIRLPPP